MTPEEVYKSILNATIEEEYYESLKIVESEIKSLGAQIDSMCTMHSCGMKGIFFFFFFLVYLAFIYYVIRTKGIWETIEKEVLRLRQDGKQLFQKRINPSGGFYRNEISINMKNWWDERCNIVHISDYIDQMDSRKFAALSAVVFDMVRQVCECRQM